MSLHGHLIQTMDILPDDMLLAIFHHFKLTERPRLASVCQRWCRIIDASYTEVEMLSMTSAMCSQSSTCLEPFYTFLRLCGPHIKELRLDMDGRYIDTVTIDHIRTHCNPNKLRTLILQNVTINGQTFLPLLGHFSALSSLALRNINSQEFDPELLPSLIAQCPRLHILDIKTRFPISPTTLQALHQSLTEFRVEGSGLEAGTLSQLLQYDVDLEVLSLRFGYVHIPDLLYVCQRARNLRYLKISSVVYFGVTNDSKVSLFTAMGAQRNLQQLHICGRQETTNQNLTDDSIQCLAMTNRPTTIQTLSLCHHKHITDAGILHLANFTQLTHLDVSHTRIHDWSLIQMVCTGANNLTHFYCCHCQNLTGSFMTTFLIQCPRLSLIGVSGCSKIDDFAVRRCIDILANRNHRLTICMDGSQITVASIISNPELRGLRLNFDWSPCKDHGHECDMP